MGGESSPQVSAKTSLGLHPPGLHDQQLWLTSCRKYESPTDPSAPSTQRSVTTNTHPSHESTRSPTIDFFRDCAVLVHEAQYPPEEYLQKVGWGHSSISNVAALVQLCGIKEWVVTHHDPAHTDDALFNKLLLQKAILKEFSIECRCQMAYDGLVLPLTV